MDILGANSFNLLQSNETWRHPKISFLLKFWCYMNGALLFRSASLSLITFKSQTKVQNQPLYVNRWHFKELKCSKRSTKTSTLLTILLSSCWQSNHPITTAPRCLRYLPLTASSPQLQLSTNLWAPRTTPANPWTQRGSLPLPLEARPPWPANHQPSCRPRHLRASRCKTAGCWVAMCHWKQGKCTLSYFPSVDSIFLQ